MNTPTPISEFTELLGRECEEATVSVDSPRDPNGEYWLDVSQRKFRTSVSWRPKVGFGIFTSADGGYGMRPDEIYSRAEDACTRICQMVARSRDMHPKAPMQLRELRHIVGRSQVALAVELEINQAAVSRMENREDMHISSLHEYITAMGGELELRAKFKDFEARIEPVRASKHKARG
jgi:hypothetical protein